MEEGRKLITGYCIKQSTLLKEYINIKEYFHLKKVNVEYIHYDEMVNGNYYYKSMEGFQLDDEHVVLFKYIISQSLH
jgi:hypothetical protein